MNVRKTLIITFVFLSILTVFRVIWLQLFTSPTQPHAVQGVLDLRDWNYLADHSVLLEGEWEFYPHAQYSDLDAEHAPEFVQIPGSWSPFDTYRALSSGGTYRLRILLDAAANGYYALHLPVDLRSSEMFINGHQSFEPGDTPYTSYFTLDGTNAIEVAVQVDEHYDLPLRTISDSPRFGLTHNVLRENRADFAIVISACAIYLMHALYCLVVYLTGMRGKRDRRLLYFAAIIMLVIFGTLETEGYLSNWLLIGPDWQLKVSNVAIIAGGYMLLQLIKPQLPKLFLKKWFNRIVLLTALMVGLSVLVPFPHGSVLLVVNSLIVFVPCSLALKRLYERMTNLDRVNIYLFLGMLAGLNSFVWFVFIEALNIDFTSYPFDLLITIICFAVYLIKLYYRILHEKEQMMFELRAADQRKDQFLVSVAHEMKTPLHGILNIAQTVMAQEYSGMKEQSARDMELLIQVGRRLSMLLNDLLDLERLKDARFPIRLEKVDVRSVARSVVDMLRLTTEGKPIEIVNRIPRNFPRVLADENRLHQILFNLIHNAVKFSYQGEVSVSATVQNGWAHVSVSDSGIGIAAEQLERIFDPYKRIPIEETTYGGGIGLGLSICKQLVERHGGTIQVRSRLNEGTTFTFTLQLWSAAEGATIEGAPIHSSAETSLELEEGLHTDTSKEKRAVSADSGDGAAATAERVRILVVDDDPVNLRVLESIFSSEKYEVFTSLHGEEALSMLDKDEWDLVIADVMMPRMSGYELTAQIRQKHAISKLPILLLTAYHREEGVEAGFRAGANDYVFKPVNAMELVARADSLVNQKRLIQESMRMEAAWLQAQIKPHFILNTITAIAALGRWYPDEMDELVVALSNYIRLSIGFQNSDRLAPLARELELVRSFILIQEKRFGDLVQVVWEIDEQVLPFDIPPLTIQPLVENAIAHGILKKRSARGTLRISIRDRGDRIAVSIADDGLGMSKETVKQLLDRRSSQPSLTGIGLANVDRRLKQFYGAGLKLESELNVGTTVSFDIPL